MIATNSRVRFQGREYHGAINLGFTPGGHFIVGLFVTPPPNPRGRFFTTIPVSTKEQRDKHLTQATALVKGRTLFVYDDHGSEYRITSTKNVIEALRLECVEQGLMAP